MAKSSLKQMKRLHYDRLMITIGVFSLLGGFLVLSSFAFRNPNTTEPGVVEISKLSNENGVYTLDIQKDLKYCFQQNGEKAEVVFYSSEGDSTILLENGCFNSFESVNGARIGLKNVDLNAPMIITRNNSM